MTGQGKKGVGGGERNLMTERFTDQIDCNPIRSSNGTRQKEDGPLP